MSAIDRRRPTMTIRQGAARGAIAPTGPIALRLSGRLAERVRTLAIESEAASAESYCEMMLEWFVVEHRSGKRRDLDPHRHTAQHAPDYSCVPNLEP